MTGPHTDVLSIYTIYQGATDIAAPFCMRPWQIGPGSPPQPGLAIPAGSLAAARALVPASADHRMPRQADDDRAILESWI